MIASFFDYFSNDHFMPHGHCFLWKPGILWLHVISDMVIALSYFSIPLMLFYFVYKKKNLPYPRVFKLFALFIFWCGLTHLIAIWTVWDPVYQIEGLTKAVTASVSFITVLFLFPIIPQLLTLRSPKELNELNHKLQSALIRKQEAETNLRVANENLESLVKQRTNELSQYAKKLHTVNNELELFAYQASHDLKSPISSLISYFQEIQNFKDNRLQKFEEYLPRMQRQLKQLNRLITDLLDLSRLGTSTITKEWFNLKDVIEEMQSNLHLKIEQKGAKIYSDLSFDVYANRLQLTLVLQNLIENSLKYIPDGKTPEIIISSVAEDDDFWKLEVKDNGIGIDAKNFDKIYEPFQRLHTLDQYPGTGLGLSICKKVIEDHGGEIYVESKLGVGSSFFFTLAKDYN